MKAAIYQGKKDIQMGELPTPHAGRNDVVIQNLYAGICGSDVAVYNEGTETGRKIQSGGEFGHEMVSRVVEVGANVTDFKVGDRVYPYPLLARGDPKYAGDLGGFSEYILVPNAKLNQQLYLVPDAISDRVAAMIEPFTVGTCAARHGHPHKGENAIVYGAGTIGLAAATALKFFGMKEVLVIDQSDFRLGIAQKLGFKTFNNQNGHVKENAIQQLGSSRGLHGECPNAAVYIDAVGRNEILQDFLDFGTIDSRFVTVGINNHQVSLDFLELIYSSKSLGGSGGYRPQDVHTVLQIMSQQNEQLDQIITKEVDWAHLEQGIQAATDVNHHLKVLVNYHVN
ncbi:zinc-dependent alcohol dehydrogenase [Lactobacillus selangorensis]|nr:alcohol dehydrogenase catalytic domain-containing protein [Lactobacillus selangorensis]